MKNYQYILLFLFLQFASACESDVGRKSFADWHATSRSGNFNISKKRTHQIISKPFELDTIYRSMKGPIDEEIFYLADSGEVVWLTGYKVEVINSKGEILDPGFVCHNNLNLDSIRKFPWQPKNFDYQNRVFTLTQGATELSLPTGYGVPVPGEQGLKAMFQALNHNIIDIDTVVRHRITIEYFLDTEIDFTIKPLFMQTLWLVKQYAGPVGNMGEKPAENAKNVGSIDLENYHPAQQPSCGVDMLANNKALNGVDMYFDIYERKYTGHWKVPPGREQIGMNVNDMLNLESKRKVVMAVGHVHPFCKELALVNSSTGEKEVQLLMKQSPNKIGLKEIQVLVPEEDIWLDPKEQYSLTSVYENTSSDTLSAMSVMYLYFEE